MQPKAATTMGPTQRRKAARSRSTEAQLRPARIPRPAAHSSALNSLAETTAKGSVNWKHSSMTISSWAQEKGKGVSHRYLRGNQVGRIYACRL